MSYTKTAIPNLGVDETGYELDDGTLVAASAKGDAYGQTEHVAGYVRITTKVRAVNSDGSARVKSDGTPLEVSHPVIREPKDAGDPSALAIVAMKVALGEDDAIGWINNNLRAQLAAEAAVSAQITLN